MRTSRLVFRYGPIRLAGYQTRIGAVPVRAPHRDGFITRMYARLVDAAGHPVRQTRVMLHHVMFVNDGRFAGDRTSSGCHHLTHEPFYGTGEEDQAMVLPHGYGYRIRVGDRWRAGWMLMNHRWTTERVYLQYTVTLATSHRVHPVNPYWVSVACTRGNSYTIAGGGARGARSRRARTWRAPISGRIVAVAAHAHGGALSVRLSRPGCGAHALASTALYAPGDDIYRLSPLLHEPSPRSMGVVTSRRGWPVRRGERLRVTSVYDAAHSHMKVMGIMHVYIARGRVPRTRCPALPSDVVTHRLARARRAASATPPIVRVDLSARGPDGRARAVTELPGPVRFERRGALVFERGFGFFPRRLSVASGSRLTWRFGDDTSHDVMVAAGPRGFASAYLKHGHRYSVRLTVPGEYRLICSLHPVDMAQTVVVRRVRR